MSVHTIKPLVQTAAWIVCCAYSRLEFKLVYESATGWIAATDNMALKILIVSGELGLVALVLIPLYTR